jgi:hypothetical protein
MVDIQTVGVVVTAASVTVAAIYYILTLRTNQRNLKTTLETRQAQLFLQLYTMFTNYEFKTKWNEVMHVWEWKDYYDFMSKYSKPEEMSKWDVVGTFFEGVGVLVKRGLVDVTLVDDLMSGQVVSCWERFRPLIYEIRVKWDWPQCMEWMEYLYLEVKGIMETQHPELVGKETRKPKPQ